MEDSHIPNYQVRQQQKINNTHGEYQQTSGSEMSGLKRLNGSHNKKNQEFFNGQLYATNDAFMSNQLLSEMSHENPQTYQRIKNINDNVIKQRQYLPQTQEVYTHPNRKSNKKGKNQNRSSGMSDGLMMLSSSTLGGDTAAHNQSQMSKAEFRNNIELLNHQQKLQMHLLEAAQFKRKYQIKKNAIDGMMNQLHPDHQNQFLVQDPEIPTSIGMLKMGQSNQPQMEYFKNSQQIRQQSQNIRQQTDISNRLKREILSGATQSHELTKYGVAQNRTVFKNQYHNNSSRTGPVKKQKHRIATQSNQDDYARQAQIYQNSAQMYQNQGVMYDLSQSFGLGDGSTDNGKYGYSSPFTDGYGDQPRGSAHLIMHGRDQTQQSPLITKKAVNRANHYQTQNEKRQIARSPMLEKKQSQKVMRNGQSLSKIRQVQKSPSTVNNDLNYPQEFQMAPMMKNSNQTKMAKPSGYVNQQQKEFIIGSPGILKKKRRNEPTGQSSAYEPREFAESNYQKIPGLPKISSPQADAGRSMPMPRSKVNIREVREERDKRASIEKKIPTKDILSVRTQELKAIKNKISRTAPATAASPVKPKGSRTEANSSAAQKLRKPREANARKNESIVSVDKKHLNENPKRKESPTKVSQKSKRKMRSIEQEDYSQSMQQINIITPNATVGEPNNKASIVNHTSQTSLAKASSRNMKLTSTMSGKKKAMNTRSANLSPLSHRSAGRNATIVPEHKQKKRDVKPRNLYNTDTDYFRKIEPEAPVLDLKIAKEDLDHLMHGDLDPISKHEVVYKILKGQLREQQKKLIVMKEEQRVKKQAKIIIQNQKKSGQRSLSNAELKKFTTHLSHFQLYGAQRDLDPKLKRIVNNLTCQEHKFMYCPRCKNYDELDFDPLENIEAFMKYVQQEQAKWKKVQQRRRVAGKGKVTAFRPLPDDSCSDITEIDKQEIMSQYYNAVMTRAQKRNNERKTTQARLYEDKKCGGGKTCAACLAKYGGGPRPSSCKNKPSVKMELREPRKPTVMFDEEVSAHQFSLHNMSVQADEEARLDAEQQTSVLELRSQLGQTSKQDAHSIQQQTSEIEFKSMNMQTSAYGDPDKFKSMECQTDPRLTRKLTPAKRTVGYQTEKVKDICKEDWAESLIFKRALRNETIKRGLEYTGHLTDSDEGEMSDDDSVGRLERQKTPEKARQDGENAQDPDSDIAQIREELGAYRDTSLAFLKSYKMKGNIKVMTESETQFAKKLLKDAHHDYWQNANLLEDLHRHTKFTIRKLTRSMANIENYKIFRKLKEPTRDHTLYLVYRAERLYAAKSHAEKIFELLSCVILEEKRVQDITDGKSIKLEDQVFLKRHEIFLHRLSTQISSFLESYKLFKVEFVFKQAPLQEFVEKSLETVKACQAMQEQEKLANPELAKAEAGRVLPKRQRTIVVKTAELGQQDPNGEIQSPNVLDTSGNQGHLLDESKSPIQLNDNSGLPYLQDDAATVEKVLNSTKLARGIREDEKVEQILLLHRQVTQGDKHMLEIGKNTDTGYQTIEQINKEVGQNDREKTYQTIEEEGLARNQQQKKNARSIDSIKQHGSANKQGDD